MKRILLSAVLVAGLAGPALAQTQSPPPPPAPMIAAEGLPSVFLTDTRGLEHRGRLLRVEPAEVVLLGEAGERTFKREEIALIEKRGDPLKNGALIGAAIGALGGLFAMGLADCPDGSGEGCAGTRAAGFLVSVGLYTAVGAGIDAAIKGRTVLYRAHPANRVAIAAGPGTVAVRFNLRW